jgi:hypothetical protein
MKKIKNYIRKTLFPRFDDEEDSVTAELTSSDSESGSDQDSERRAKYATKEDEDVAVFLRLAEQMSIHSLLFLLQNHARQMNLPEECLQQSLRRGREAGSAKGQLPASPKSMRQKKFRFAEICNGRHVRAETHEVPVVDSFVKPALWWTEEEMREIRRESARTVRYFRKHKLSFAESCMVLAESAGDDAEDDVVVEHHMKKLTNDSFARGLEAHIVSPLGKKRKHVVKAVLEEQADSAGDEYGEISERLREASLHASSQSRTFALKMGECDQIDALKAAMAKWEEPGRKDSDSPLSGVGEAAIPLS